MNNDSNNDYGNQHVINEKQINNDAFTNTNTPEETVNINHHYPPANDREACLKNRNGIKTCRMF